MSAVLGLNMSETRLNLLFLHGAAFKVESGLTVDRTLLFILTVFFLYFSRKLTFFFPLFPFFSFSFSLFDGVLVFDLDAPLSLFLFSSLSELLGDLLNGASSTPVSTTTVVGRDLFFGEWMDEVNGGGGIVGVQSVRITVPSRYISLNGCALAAQRNSGIVVRKHSTVTTTNHLEVVAGDVRFFRIHTITLTILYRAPSRYHPQYIFRHPSVPLSSLNF